MEEGTNIDSYSDRTVSRIFHNKVSSGFFEFSKAYAQTFEPRLLLEVLGPLGLALALLALINALKTVNRLAILHLFIILAVSLLAISTLPPKTAFYLLALSWYTFSLWGLSFFLKGAKYQITFIVLIIMTSYYYAFTWQLTTFCHEIFFN